MKTVKITCAMNHAKNAAITVALWSLMISSVAPRALAQTGWAVGKRGTILTTTTGDKWTTATPPDQNADILSFSFVAGYLSVIVRNNVTNDWRIYSSDKPLQKDPGWKMQLRTGLTLNAISVRSEKKGIAVGEDGTIFWANAGKWIRSYKDEKKETNWTDKTLRDVFFFDDKNAWVVGDKNTILRTTDSGKTWESLTLPVPERAQPRNFSSISIVDAQTWWFTSGDGILWTTNGAKDPKKDWNWSEFGFGGFAGIQALKDKDKQNVWVIGTSQTPPLLPVSFMLSNPTWGKTKQDWSRVDGLTYEMAGTLRSVSFVGPPAKPNGWVAGDKGIFRNNFDGAGWKKTWGPGVIYKITMFPKPNKKQQVKLDTSTSPEGGAADVNYVSVTGSGFPEGNIDPANVVVQLAADCHGAAYATTSAVSLVSGSGDSRLASFLLPSGLDPGQYFVSISDSEEGDANFESSNCSEVRVSQ